MSSRLIKKLYTFFKYPCLLPQEVGQALGLEELSFESFASFLSHLEKQSYSNIRLKKFMPRERAEALFNSAPKRETFRSESLFSFQFSNSWLGICLKFDENNLLRRAYLMHERLPKGQLELTIESLAKGRGKINSTVGSV